MLEIGDTFLQSIPGINQKHLYIIINKRYHSNTENLIVISVNFTSCPSDSSLIYDTSCKIFVGDHSFIKHDSYIDYRWISFFDANKLEQEIELGLVRKYDPVSTCLLDKIREGAKKSDFLEPRYLEYF